MEFGLFHLQTKPFKQRPTIGDSFSTNRPKVMFNSARTSIEGIPSNTHTAIDWNIIGCFLKWFGSPTISAEVCQPATKTFVEVAAASAENIRSSWNDSPIHSKTWSSCILTNLWHPGIPMNIKWTWIDRSAMGFCDFMTVYYLWTLGRINRLNGATMVKHVTATTFEFNPYPRDNSTVPSGKLT